MNNLIVDDGAVVYTRVSKVYARKLWASGTNVYVIAHKMRPGMPFSLGMIMYSVENGGSEPFDTWVNNFAYCNASCNETGVYCAYYTMKEKVCNSEK